jgi:hypothetical protein
MRQQRRYRRQQYAVLIEEYRELALGRTAQEIELRRVAMTKNIGPELGVVTPAHVSSSAIVFERRTGIGDYHMTVCMLAADCVQTHFQKLHAVVMCNEKSNLTRRGIVRPARMLQLCSLHCAVSQAQQNVDRVLSRKRHVITCNAESIRRNVFSSSRE